MVYGLSNGHVTVDVNMLRSYTEQYLENCLSYRVQVWYAAIPSDSLASCSFKFLLHFITARCTLVQSAVLRLHVVCLSVCNVGEL